MNKVFKNVWNSSLGVWVAVSETCKGQKKSSNKLKKGLVVAAILSGVSGAALAQIGTTGGEYNAGGTAISSCGTTNGIVEENEAHAGPGGVAIGCGATALSPQSSALGDQATAGAGSVVIGYQAKGDKQDVVVIGIDAEIENSHTIAIGANAKGFGAWATAIGIGAETAKDNSTAIGYRAKSLGRETTTLGFRAQADGDRSIAIGADAAATKNDSIALGYKATTDAAAKYSEVTSTIVNGVEQSLSAAGTSPVGVLSLGNHANKLQIHNVAAGRVTSTSTDAINGSQLHSVWSLLDGQIGGVESDLENLNDRINKLPQGNGGSNTWSLSVNGESPKEIQDGQTVDISGDKNITAAATDTGVAFALNKDINLGADGSLSVGQVVINDKGINAGGQVIAGVAKATADDHAVNYSQLTELKQTLQQEITQIDGAAGWNLVTGGVESAVAGKASTLEIAGKNISAKQSQLTDDQGNVTGTKLEVELDDNIELSDKGSLKVGNTVLDADGILVGQNQLTSQGLTVGKVLIDNTGINAGSQVITGVAAGSKNDHAVNYGQLVALQDNVQGAIQNSGWTSTINGESATQVKNGDTFDISSGSNINVTSTADGIQIALDKNVNLGADGSFAVGQVVINDQGINAGGQVIAGVGEATKDDHAVNLGQMNERFDEFSQDMTSGINNAGWNIVGTDADGNQTTSKIKNDQSVSFEAGKNTIVSTELTATGAKVTVDLKDEITLDGEKGGLTVGAGKGKDAITIQQGNVNLGGNQVNNIAAGTSANDATTVDQLKGAINIFGGGATINADGGIVAPEYTIHGSTYKNVETALGALNQADIDLGDRIDNLGDRVNNLQQSFSNRLENVEDRMSAGIASAMALETAPYVAGKYTYSAATAYHNGQAAFGLTLRKTSDNGLWSLTGGVAAATEGDPSVRLGISGVIK